MFGTPLDEDMVDSAEAEACDVAEAGDVADVKPAGPKGLEPMTHWRNNQTTLEELLHRVCAVGVLDLTAMDGALAQVVVSSHL